MMPSAKLENISTISPNGAGQVVVTSDLNLVATPAPVYRINGVPLNFVTNPAGTNGQVQYNNNGAFGASANLIWDNANGRLGIGTANPVYPLDVNGNFIARGLTQCNELLVGGNATFVQNITVSGGVTFYGPVTMVGQLVNYNYTSLGGLTVTRSATTPPTLFLQSGDSFTRLNIDTPEGSASPSISSTINGVPSPLLLNPTGGNVGIGTATPTSRLSIVGLPTSAAGLSPGDVWNNGGVLNIV